MEIGNKTIAFGEVGLSGEIRGVSQPEVRVAEAVKLGFERCVVPAVCMKNLEKMRDKIQLIAVKSIAEAFNIVTG